MAHLQNTLESSGYLFNPFTQSDTWGAPSQLNLTAVTKSDLPVGADDSALPVFSDATLLNSAPLQGSAVTPKHTPYADQAVSRDKYLMLAGFIAVLALALYSRR